MQGLDQLLEQARQEIAAATDLKTLDSVRVAVLGKKGSISQLLKSIGELPQEERPLAGEAINKAKKEFSQDLEARKQELESKNLQSELQASSIDVTAPAREVARGSLHPVRLVTKRCVDFFTSIGFELAQGPEIEDDYHNFAALNIPEHHPARAEHDTFYLKGIAKLLRTHTSPVQIREASKQKPPIKLVAPGRVYRRDFDLSHTPMFHQLEVLLIDRGVNFGHLKAVLHNFLQAFFARKLEIRLRASYFPFTEPSAEVDIQCVSCYGKGCRVCSDTGWLELLGCGMVHPVVLTNCNIDPNEYTGFAFGMGLDRLAMLYYKIHDLRLMFENDLRFLQQF